MPEVTIYHNPRCSKSRQTLELLKENGHDPIIVEYLKTPPSAATLLDIASLLGGSLHDMVRTGESTYTSEMANQKDEALAELMQKEPILLQRPIVVANGKAKIGRPPESVLDIL